MHSCDRLCEKVLKILKDSEHKFSKWAFIQAAAQQKIVPASASEHKRSVISALASTGQRGVDGEVQGDPLPPLPLLL